MQEEKPEKTSSLDGDIIDLTIEKLHSHNISPRVEELTEQEEDDNASEDDLADRRKFPRAVFTYPVEFKLFSQSTEHVSYNGELKDISLSGACMQFEDKYGRLSLKDLNNAKIKITFSIPHGGKASILALIRWIKKIDPRSFSIKLGIEFQDVENWQMEAIEKLIGMRNKDHNMMWNLWEQYEK
ncbi:MAG: PilZ domain-containing protein [Nitrospirae bacterium]|nr:PilZ domain-containing protein [Nitrospirota bacterium]